LAQILGDGEALLSRQFFQNIGIILTYYWQRNNSIGLKKIKKVTVREEGFYGRKNHAVIFS
jgi:hypothetical protein